MILFTKSMILLVLCLIGSGICDQKVSEPQVRTDPNFFECDIPSHGLVKKAIACPQNIIDHIIQILKNGGQPPPPPEACCVKLDMKCSDIYAIKRYCKTKPGFDEKYDKIITDIQKNCSEHKPSKSVCQPFIDKYTAIIPECGTHSYSCNSEVQTPDDPKPDSSPSPKDAEPKDSSVTPVSLGSLSLCISLVISLFVWF